MVPAGECVMTHYIHGMHVGSHADHIGNPWTSTGAALMVERPGVLVFTEIVGDGHDYSVWSDAGYTVLVRLNYSYGDGTIPPIAQYAQFAQRCAVMVANSWGVDGWVIGNEPNFRGEWPGGVQIAAEDYAICFDMCRTAIQVTAPVAKVLVAGIAPYNADAGDWVDYLEWVLDETEYDGVCVHAYTHGHKPALIASEAMMDPPYQNRHYEFRTYRDFMSVIPDGVPVWITESNPGADPDNTEWQDVNNGWARAAYAEIDQWNQAHSAQQIRGLCLYRYPAIDEWRIVGNAGVEADFAAAVDAGYEWTEEEPMAEWAMNYITSMDDGFYPYTGQGPLTVPYGSVPLWEDDPDEDGALDRPEYATRADPHVHTSPNAAGMFSMYSTMEGAIVYEIPVKPGDEVRASVWGMGVDGQSSQMSLRAGIAVDNPGEGAITVTANDGKFAGVLESRANWGDWYGANVDGEWQQMWTPVDTATRDRVWIVLNARKDVRKPGHSHWDDLIVEVRDGGVEPPDPPDPADPPDGTLGDLLGNLEAALSAAMDAYIEVVDYVDTNAVRALVV